MPAVSRRSNPSRQLSRLGARVRGYKYWSKLGSASVSGRKSARKRSDVHLHYPELTKYAVSYFREIDEYGPEAWDAVQAQAREQWAWCEVTTWKDDNTPAVDTSAVTDNIEEVTCMKCLTHFYQDRNRGRYSGS